MTSLAIEIITPQAIILESSATWITLPGVEGELGILPHHVPLLTALNSGVLHYASEGKTRRVAVHYGYAEVRGNTVSVLAKMAEHGTEINLQRAAQSHEKSKKMLAALAQEPDADMADKYEAKLRRSLIRQQAARLG